MKRAIKYGLITLLAAALICAAGGTSWLLGTTDGARWVMAAISRHTPLKISARQVGGRLLDRLRLGGVRVVLAPFEVEIEGLNYRLQPLLLLAGQVSSPELTMSGVRIQDNNPPDIHPDLAWPRVSGMARLFDGRIGRLRVSGLSYRHLNGQLIHVNAISSSVSWEKALLSLSDLAATSPGGRVTGNIAAGFARPTLKIDLTVTTTRIFAGMKTFSLQGRFLPGLRPEQLAGSFAVAGVKDKVNFLELAGEMGLTRSAFNFRRLRLTQPGRRGSVTGGGTVTPTAQAPLLALRLTAAGLDLSPELNAPTNLSGTMTLTGTPELYRGEIKLANGGKGWQAAHLSGLFQGNSEGIKVTPLTGSLLAGSVQGSLDFNWGQEVSLKGTVRGRNLNPARISPDWIGLLNFDLLGGIAWPSQTQPRGEVSGKLLESRLHGQALTGEVRADFARGDLRVERLVLRGKGFAISAAGTLGKGLTFNVQSDQLGRLIPQAAGKLQADGWVQRQDGRLEVAITGRGSNLAIGGLRIAAANLTARFGTEKGYPLHVTAKLRKAAYGRFQVDSVTVKTDGTTLQHTINVALRSADAAARIALAGSYGHGSWGGKIIDLSGQDNIGPWNIERPSPLSITAVRVVLTPLILVGARLERIEISGELTEEPLGGSVRAAWAGLNLARVNPWLPRELHLDGSLAGSAAGKILPGRKIDFSGKISLARGKFRWQKDGDTADVSLPTADISWRWQGGLPASTLEIGAGQLVVAGRVALSGNLTMDGQQLAVEGGLLHFDGDDRGLRAGMEFRLPGGGVAKGAFSSSAPARLAVPSTGDVTAECKGLDLALFRHWLPGAIHLEGRLAGRAQGNLLPGQKFALKGDATISEGKIHRLRPEGEFNLNLRSTSVSWDWQGEALRGTFSLALMERGQARGSFQLPIPARHPVAFDRQGPLLASLTGQVLEKGLLASLFPGLIRESRGELDADLRIGGIWNEPTIKGEIKLAKAGAYLPTAGIHVSDVQLAMQLEKDTLRIVSFRALSGPGHIEGTALLRIKKWRVASYSGRIDGERFQLVYLPELQIMGSPRLTFDGTMEKLTIHGEMRLPELLIFGPPTRAVVLPSPDVILEGVPQRTKKTDPLALDVNVRLTLGERVLAKVEGIDARLEGGIDVIFQSLDKITSKGEIKVAKGRYRAYGVDLEIVRGRLFYAGGPINQPTLDILALRTVGPVRAGVAATGNLRAPLINLYSEPAMPDVDILAYIVFGRPLGRSNDEQAGMMAQVASILLSKGQSVVLQEQIKNRLGLSTLELQAGGTEATGGYKPIPVAPPGVTGANQVPGVSQTMLTVGKYLTPQLYFSYGRSLFTGSNLFRLRYDLFKRWQIETQTGNESGVDLYYRIEFD